MVVGVGAGAERSRDLVAASGERWGAWPDAGRPLAGRRGGTAGLLAGVGGPLGCWPAWGGRWVAGRRGGAGGRCRTAAATGCAPHLFRLAWWRGDFPLWLPFSNDFWTSVQPEAAFLSKGRGCRTHRSGPPGGRPGAVPTVDPAPSRLLLHPAPARFPLHPAPSRRRPASRFARCRHPPPRLLLRSTQDRFPLRRVPSLRRPASRLTPQRSPLPLRSTPRPVFSRTARSERWLEPASAGVSSAGPSRAPG
jgi:hypothetical protein